MPSFIEKITEQIKQKPAVAAGVAVGGVVTIYLFMKSNKTKSSSITGDTTQTDPLNGFDVANIAGIPYGAEWSNYRYNSSQGNTQQDDTANTPTGSNNQKVTATVNGSAILASTPGGTNNKGSNITNIPNNTVLTVLGAEMFNDTIYYKVDYNGQTGYVNSHSVKNVLATGYGGSSFFGPNRLMHDYAFSANGHELDPYGFI